VYFGIQFLSKDSHYFRIIYVVNRYRVIQEEMSVFWKVMLSVIARQKVHTNVVLILYDYRDGYHVLIQLDFCLRFWIKGEVYKRKADRRDELLARILGSATFLVKLEVQLRRATRYIGTRFSKCFEVDDGIFEHLL
jgi:hypothetical protein